MNKLRVFTATLALSLTISACDSRGVTDPIIHPSPAPALDGIGMVGGGGRSADGEGSDSTATAQGDSATTAVRPQ